VVIRCVARVACLTWFRHGFPGGVRKRCRLDVSHCRGLVGAPNAAVHGRCRGHDTPRGCGGAGWAPCGGVSMGCDRGESVSFPTVESDGSGERRLARCGACPGRRRASYRRGMSVWRVSACIRSQKKQCGNQRGTAWELGTAGVKTRDSTCGWERSTHERVKIYCFMCVDNYL